MPRRHTLADRRRASRHIHPLRTTDQPISMNTPQSLLGCHFRRVASANHRHRDGNVFCHVSHSQSDARSCCPCYRRAYMEMLPWQRSGGYDADDQRQVRTRRAIWVMGTAMEGRTGSYLLPTLDGGEHQHPRDLTISSTALPLWSALGEADYDANDVIIVRVASNHSMDCRPRRHLSDNIHALAGEFYARVALTIKLVAKFFTETLG
ncbi:hypothetical protein JAAARDRAFT_470301 [Jaapia argillacea MUCL 33604]|uniref:Uncharacterized protein n=1 Tax=Jaapia argillacea MUCL 33604 TaxID=933084 RepID=A0A067Q6Z0_9AGAM|nr:hypothetical protein JAAARDRAFT_470301 [Jaapia argillacea MUCL 33604]